MPTGKWFQEESDYYFDEQIKNCYRSIELKREYAHHYLHIMILQVYMLSEERKIKLMKI